MVTDDAEAGKELNALKKIDAAKNRTANKFLLLKIFIYFGNFFRTIIIPRKYIFNYSIKNKGGFCSPLISFVLSSEVSRRLSAS